MDRELLGRTVARVGGAGGLASLLVDFPGPERLSDFGLKQTLGVLAGLALVAVGQLIQRRGSASEPSDDGSSGHGTAAAGPRSS